MAPVRELDDSNPDGTRMGQSASDLISFYGATPVSQRATSLQATSGPIAVSSTFGTVQVAVFQEIMNTLAGLGMWKGAA